MKDWSSNGRGCWGGKTKWKKIEAHPKLGDVDRQVEVRMKDDGTRVNIHTLKQPIAHWRLFPAATTVAFYDSFSQYIQLSDISSNELLTALRQLKGQPAQALRPLSLLFHELRHWVDHISTLWGQHRLVAAFNAMNARRRNIPQEFWRIQDFMRLVDRDTFGEYYQTIEQVQMPHGLQRAWQYQFTSGMRFDESGRLDEGRPIFFTRYAWSDGTSACRVPFSLSALLETAAMQTEYAVESFLVDGFGEVEQRIERDQIKERRLKELYTPELAIYSTAVHAVANRMDLNDAGDAYLLAATLASFCLNLPSAQFDVLIVPNEFRAFWGDRNERALANRDRGYAYLLLLFHADKALVHDPHAWLESAAAKAGLRGNIKAIAIEERDTLAGQAIDGPFRERLVNLLGLGNAMFESFGMSYTIDSVAKDLSKVVCPPILCSDLKWLSLGPATPIYNDEEVENWWTECSDLEHQFEEFVAACGR